MLGVLIAILPWVIFVICVTFAAARHFILKKRYKSEGEQSQGVIKEYTYAFAGISIGIAIGVLLALVNCCQMQAGVIIGAGIGLLVGSIIKGASCGF